MLFNKIKNWWNKPIKKHIKGEKIKGRTPFVELHIIEHDELTTNGKEILETLELIFMIILVLFLCGLFLSLIIKL